MSGKLSPQEIKALKDEIHASLHCALPGTVEAFDPETQTVSVRPALHLSSRPERSGAEGSPPALPLIRDVPVFFPGSRDSALTWPVSAGDGCLLVFADADIDRWFETGEPEAPDSGRRHSLSDAFAFVGFRSKPDALQSLPANPSFFGVRPAAINHTHKAADITAGIVPRARGGSGQMGTGSTTTASEVATPGTDCTITNMQFAWWGKLAMLRVTVKKRTAVSSGVTTLCTLLTGKRPIFDAAAQWNWGSGAVVRATGAVQVNGAIAADATLYIHSTYILA